MTSVARPERSTWFSSESTIEAAPHPYEESTLGVLAAAWRFRWLCLAIVVLCGAASGGVGLLTAPPPTAEATLALTNPRADNVLAPGTVGDASLARFTAQQADFLQSDDLFSRLAVEVPATSNEELRQRIQLTASTDSNSIVIEGTGDSPQEAVALTTALVEAYRNATAEAVTERTGIVLDSINDDIAQISSEVSELDADSPEARGAADSIAQLRGNASEIKTDSAAYGDGVDWATFAAVADVDVAGVPVKELVVGGLLGLAVAAVTAWILSDRRREVRNVTQLSRLLHAPCLAAVSPSRRARDGTYDRDSFVVAAVAVRARCTGGVLLVVDPGSSGYTGKVTRGIGCGLALQGSRVLLVDSDFTRKDERGARAGNAVADEGFAEFVQGGGRGEPVLSAVRLDDLDVDVMSRGSLAGGFTAMTPMGDLRRDLGVLRSGRDFVVVDGGHLGRSPMTSILAAHCDAMVVMVQEGTREEELIDLKSISSALNAPILGYVFLRRRRR